MTKEILEDRLDTFALETVKPQKKVVLENEIKEMSGREIQSLKDMQEMSMIDEALDQGKSFRGKSAKAIEMQLTTEAFKNLSRAHEVADIRKWQKETVHTYREESEHRQIIEELQTNLTEMEKISEPLSALKRQLKNYEEKTSNYFSDTRYSRKETFLCVTSISSSSLRI